MTGTRGSSGSSGGAGRPSRFEDSRIGWTLSASEDRDIGGRAGSSAAAAPRAGKPLPAHTLSLPRRVGMRVGGTGQAHRCAGGRVGSTRITLTELAAGNRRARFPATHCDGALRRRVGRRPRSPAAASAGEGFWQSRTRAPIPRAKRAALTEARSAEAPTAGSKVSRGPYRERSERPEIPCAETPD